jgi:opacity protein-like surface antigen
MSGAEDSKMITGAKSTCWRNLGRALALAASMSAIAAIAQVVPSGTGPGRALWVGAEYSNFDASFPYQSNQRITGYDVFADYFFTNHLGVEADARFLNFLSFHGESESNYLAGPQYRSRSLGKLQLYGQGLVGLGKIQFPFSVGNGSYFAVVPGGGVNYRLARRWQLRAGYDYERWLNSPNIANAPAHEITPSGFHVGLAFAPLR